MATSSARSAATPPLGATAPLRQLTETTPFTVICTTSHQSESFVAEIARKSSSGRLRGSQALVDPLRSRLMAYLFDEPDAEPEISELNWKVSDFRYQFGLIVLELKLWKTACILNPPKPMLNMTSVYFWASNGGWKENKQAMRRDRLVTVVLENVRPFLGPSIFLE